MHVLRWLLMGSVRFSSYQQCGLQVLYACLQLRPSLTIVIDRVLFTARG